MARYPIERYSPWPRVKLWLGRGGILLLLAAAIFFGYGYFSDTKVAVEEPVEEPEEEVKEEPEVPEEGQVVVEPISRDGEWVTVFISAPGGWVFHFKDSSGNLVSDTLTGEEQVSGDVEMRAPEGAIPVIEYGGEEHKGDPIP